jgi:hypothetical protein
MQINVAPVSLHELMPTIAYSAGLDTAELGDTIYDIDASQPRKRVCLLRGSDDSYPSVVRYDGVDNGGANVYFAYTYVGDRWDYIYAFENDLYDVIPAANSFY